MPDDKGAFSSTQSLLSAAIAVVVAVFAGFGGFLDNIAPPDLPVIGLGKTFAVGLASFIALIVLLIIQYGATFLQSKKWTLMLWLAVVLVGAAAFIITALNYQESLADKTFAHVSFKDNETTRMIKGDHYTPHAQAYVDSNKVTGPEDVMRSAGSDDPTVVWTKSSIIAAHTVLLRQYQILVGTLCIALFSLLALVLTRRDGG